MFAKIVSLFTALGVVQATGLIKPIGLGGLGYGAGLGHGIISYGEGLGYGGAGLISGGVPAVATQKAVINHAPATPAVAASPISLAGHAYGLGYAGNGLLGGHGLGGTGLITGGVPAVATQKAVINHAPAAPVVAAAPIALTGPTYGLGYFGNGLIGGHGFALGNGLLGAPYGLGLGVGKLGLGLGKTLL